ncbi:general secretion pathway protein GspI, partial [Pseudomonas syringae]|nr:general secretion pathway protein GspI [Pseudomonas syringae]
GTLAGIDWTLDIRQLSGANGQTRMFRLDLMVSEHQRKAQFSTLKLRGAVSGAAGGAGS